MCAKSFKKTKEAALSTVEAPCRTGCIVRRQHSMPSCFPVQNDRQISLAVHKAKTIFQEASDSNAIVPQSSTFMGKMRAYRNKQRARSASKSGDDFDDGGPLQQGMSGRPQQKLLEQKRGPSQRPQNGNMKEFFDRVSEAKACFWPQQLLQGSEEYCSFNSSASHLRRHQ